MRSLGWAQIQYDWYPHKKDKFGHRETHIRRIICKDKGDTSKSQEMPEISSKPPEAKGEV